MATGDAAPKKCGGRKVRARRKGEIIVRQATETAPSFGRNKSLAIAMAPLHGQKECPIKTMVLLT